LIGDLWDGLKLNLQAGINYTAENNRDIAKSIPLYNWDGTLAYYTIANPGESSLTPYSSQSTYRNYTGYLQYNKTIAGKHNIDLMGGASYEENDFDWFRARRDNFITDDVWSLNLGGTNNMSNDGGGNSWAIGSLFSRLSYVYDNKYILEGNLRYDGSSRFQSSTRWGLFPGVSAAWRVSKESFFKKIKFVNDLKLRASYGETGNQEGIGLYDYLQLINVGGVYPFGAGSQTQSASLAGMVSLDRTWETLVNRNIGLDATLFNSKFNFSFDYFVKTNRNLLIPVTYPSLLGAVAPYSNSGKLKTWGIEASLGYNNKIGNLEYSARLLFSDAQNKVLNYGGADTYKLGLNTIREGYPINTYFAYEFDGLIRTQAELDSYKQLGGVPSDIGIGDARFKDLNGDGTISPYGSTAGDNGDVINAGTISPRYNFGLNLGAKFKSFDVSVFVQGVGKRSMFRDGEYSMPWSDWWRQPARFYYGQTWNEDRPDARYPRLSHGNIRYWNYQASSLQRINAAYARLKNLQIGYTLPKSIMSKVSVSNARIYFSGQDLWELHNVKGGWDPESATNGFNYPFQRLYSFGLDLTF
jgi:TonB-linked SusC/RagA family outer membrane protein